jgi:tetratricopeptide (TPR) repeat protein
MKLLSRFNLSVVLLTLCVSFALAQTPETPDTTTQETQVNLNKVKLLLDQAKEALLQGDEEKANKFLGQVVEQARKAWDMNNATTAEAVFRQVLTLKPDNAEALFGLAELYRRTNPVMAVEYYTRYLQSHPSDPAAYYGRGSCYLARDAYSLAIQDLETLVTRLEPNNVGGLTNLALAYRGRAAEKNYDSDLFEKAVKYMRDAVTAAGNSNDEETKKILPELKYRLGRIIFEHQQILARSQMGEVNFAEAIDYLQQSIQDSFQVSLKNLDNQQALSQMVSAYDALAEVFDAQSQLNPKDPAPYLQLAQLANRRAMIIVRQSRILSLNYLKKAVELDPKNTQSWILLADAYAQLGNLKEATVAIDKALELDPENTKFQEMKKQLISATQPAKQ